MNGLDPVRILTVAQTPPAVIKMSQSSWLVAGIEPGIKISR